MANIFTRIQRKVNRGDFFILQHCFDALNDENFLPSDAVNVVLSPFNQFEFTEDESHVRYCFEGNTVDGRMLAVIVFIEQGIVFFKTAYEL